MLDYSLLVLPVPLLIGAEIVLAPPERDLLFRVMLLILGFVLIRDAMTPAGFWEFGASNGVPWLRFTDDVLVPVMFGGGSLALTAGLLAVMPGLRALVRRADLTCRQSRSGWVACSWPHQSSRSRCSRRLSAEVGRSR